MEPEALFFDGGAESGIRCSLCPRRCSIPEGRFGGCGVRGNEGGKGAVPFYGLVTALALDPIEKKPLFHFRPGSSILSVGFAGCNLSCPFCQNSRISGRPASSSGAALGGRVSPAEIVSAAADGGGRAIAYTYSEPLVHAEFLLDCMSLARKRGLANVLVTNGCVLDGPAGEILSLADAANIDLKSFSRATYARVLGGLAAEAPLLETVLAFIWLAREKGVHVELTTLVVPGLNDSAGELDSCADFIASLNARPDLPEIPWHLCAYRPAHLWKAPPTDPCFLLRARERACRKLRFVYVGNIPGEENDTRCPCCGDILVRRLGYATETSGLAEPAKGGAFFLCAGCGGETGISR